MNIISKKICLVGDFGVGKTSLIRRFVDRQFSDQYLCTVGVKISRKLVEVSTDESETQQKLQLLIWDIEGQTKFKAIAPTYLQGAKGAIIVADVSRPETVENLSDHIQLFLSVNPQGVMVVAFNKSDLVDETQLEYLFKLKQFNEEQVLATYSTSAKTGVHIDRIFQVLSHQIAKPR